jgi:hypothetical protein
MVLDKNKIHVFDKATEKSLHTVTAQEMEKYKNI